jgi:hypothetical protein
MQYFIWKQLVYRLFKRKAFSVLTDLIDIISDPYVYLLPVYVHAHPDMSFNIIAS